MEDEQSSRLYFEGFRRELRTNRIIVIAEHTGSDPRSVVSAAKSAKNDRIEQAKRGLDDEFDEIWVVFDTEGPQNLERQRAARNAIAQCHQLQFKTAVSNPCFEFWLLLHFKYFVKQIQDGNAASSLLREYIPDYRKGLDCFLLVRDQTDRAIERAKRIVRERYEFCSQHPCDCHPFTEVYRLVESLVG